ncbi:MAG TPA: DUF3224 domain-containing protein [Actinopolymorphaceae bacterium]|jgi:hypothetical protein|nr:DUF3224 domain-containing protein [Actinopolymorphaceae bacterium]
MTSKANGTFRTTSWDEKPPSDDDKGPRLSHAHTTTTFDGVVEGSSTADYVMYYSGQGEGWGSGTYTGLEQITGTVEGRSGSFVVQHAGEFGGTTVSTRWTVLPGSGTGALADLRGEGAFSGGHGEDAVAYTFDYQWGGK